MRQGQLGEFVDFAYGKGLPARNRKPGSIPVFGSAGCVDTHDEALVEGPGVIIGRKGTVGAVHWSDSDFYPIDTTYYVISKSDELRLRYVYYLLITLPLQYMNTDVAVPGLNKMNALRLKVTIASPSKQDRIIDILSAYDDLIENNRRRIQLLEQSARLLYKEWFVHLRFPGHEHVKIKDGIPEGWEICTIADTGNIVTGKTPSKKRKSYYGDDVPFIKTPDMHGNTVVTSTEEKLSEEGANSQANKTLPPRSVLVSCIGTVGAVAFNAASAQTNQQINAIVPKSYALRYWIFFMAKTLKPLLEGMGGGATMANVNKSKFSSMRVVIPSKLMLAQFNFVVTPIIDQIEQLALMNVHLSNSRDLLLPRLMKGKIAV